MLNLPEQASKHAAAIDQMVEVIHWFMLVLFVIWGVFYIYCLVRFRAGSNPKADYHGLKSHASSYIEAGVVLFEAVLLFVFAFPLWGKWVGNFPARNDAVEVSVIAQQFAWNFHYPGPDGEFGRRSANLIDPESNPVGLDRKNDPKAADDFVSVNQLHLPINKPALIHVNSRDVIHSFKILAMRVTQDAIPGISIPITFEPNKIGKFEIVCSQLCGLGHYSMRGFVNVQSPKDFGKWYEERQAELSGAEEPW